MKMKQSITAGILTISMILAFSLFNNVLAQKTFPTANAGRVNTFGNYHHGRNFEGRRCGNVGDRREAKWDRREDRKDRKEDIRDRKDDRWDRRDVVRDRREDRLDRREDKWDNRH